MKKLLMLGAAAFAAASVTVPTYADTPASGAGGIVLAQDKTAPTAPGTKPPTAAERRAEEAMRERIARLEAAEPATKASVSADAFIGTEIRNMKDRKLGSVKDLVLLEGKVVAIVVARGGVLGMGTDHHRIDLAHAKITADAKTVVLDLAEEQVKALPKVAYKDGKWNQVADDKSSPPSTAPAAPPTRTTPPATEKMPEPAPKAEPPAKSDEPPKKSE